MKVRSRTDPRLETLFGLEDVPDGGIRPIVPFARKGPPTWIFAVAAIVGAGLLFAILEARRTAPGPDASSQPQAASVASPQPQLFIPPSLAAAPSETIGSPAVALPQPGLQPVAGPRVIARPAAVSQFIPAPMPYPATVGMIPAPPQSVRAGGGQALLVDSSGALGAMPNPGAGESTGAGQATEGKFGGRMRSSTLANRSNTVVQGTMIPATLETAFNSTQPGLARAIVARDVRGFDGSRVLVPRGSRLIGEYRANVGPGQKRAVISWTRLIRPDGVTIGLNSPAVDPLGRGGIPASVKSQFLERVTGTLLQSVLNIGENLATGSVSGGLVVVPSGGGRATVAGGQAPRILTVPPGRSISVFVAHDLEFASDGQQL